MELETAEGSLPTEETQQGKLASLWFRIHGLLDRMQESLKSRRPDDQPIADGDGQEDLRDLVKQFARTVEVVVKNSGGHGNVHNNGNGKVNMMLFTTLVTANVLTIGWFASRVITKLEDHDTRIAILECKTNPECLRQVANGR